MYAVSQTAEGRTSYRAVSSADDLLPGEVTSPLPPAPSAADVSGQLVSSIQCWLDATAHGNGYDSMATCVSYKDSGVTRWAADAAAAIAWRDAVWQAAFSYQEANAANPPNPWPTAEQVIAQMPQPSEFGWTTHSPGESVA